MALTSHPISNKMTIMKQSHLFYVSLLAAGISFSNSSQANNLLETFKLTQQHDAQWAAKKSKFLGDKESVEQAKGLLRPSAALTAKWAQIKTDAPSGEIDQASAQNCSLGFSSLFSSFDFDNPDANLTQQDLQKITSCDDFFTNLSTAFTVEPRTNNLMQYALTAKQPLFRLDYWYNRASALSALSAGQADLAASQQDLMMRTAEAYFNVLKTQEDLRLARSEEKTLSIALSELKNRYKVGLLRDTDVFETQASYDLAKAAVIVADAEHDNAKQLLVMMTGEQDVLVNPLPKDIPIDPPKPLALAEWEEFSRRNNLTLLASRFVVNSKKQDVYAKRSGHAPSVDLGADYTRSQYTGDTETENDTTTVGISVTVPLFAGGITSSQEKQSRFRLQEAQENSELAMRNALRETRQYHTKVNSDVAAVEARAMAVRSSASAYRSIKLGYDNGLRTLTDVLGSQRKLFQARKDYATSKYLYIIDTLRLKKAAGVLAADDLEVLNSWLDTATTQTNETEELGGLTMDEIDGIKLKAETKVFGADAKKSSHKSLYDAFKAWKEEKK